jgi:hypothetical protein
MKRQATSGTSCATPFCWRKYRYQIVKDRYRVVNAIEFPWATALGDARFSAAVRPGYFSSSAQPPLSCSNFFSDWRLKVSSPSPTWYRPQSLGPYRRQWRTSLCAARGVARGGVGQMSDVLVRVIPSLAWCVMVLIGVYFITSSGKTPEEPLGVVVGQKLPANFYFLARDKTAANAAGSYVASPKGAKVGAVLRRGDLADRPGIPVFRQSKFLLSAPVAPAAIRAGLNAGARPRICGKGGTSYGDATIQFVACDCNAESEVFCAAVVETSDLAGLEGLGKAVKDPAALSEIHVAEACK